MYNTIGMLKRVNESIYSKCFSICVRMCVECSVMGQFLFIYSHLLALSCLISHATTYNILYVTVTYTIYFPCIYYAPFSRIPMVNNEVETEREKCIARQQQIQRRRRARAGLYLFLSSQARECCVNPFTFCMEMRVFSDTR